MEGLSTICAGLGIVEEDENGTRIGYVKGEFCSENLKDLLRFLRRDDPQTRDVFKQVCKWNTVSKDLIPIIEHCQDDRNLVIDAVKVLVFLTMPIEATSNDISQQIEYLWGLKSSITRSDAVAVIVTLLEGSLENLESEAFTEDDWKLLQLVLTLFRNILAVQDISTQQKASGSAPQFLSLRDRFLELMFHENVMDLILVVTQHVGGSCGYLRKDNLLLLETFHFIFLGQEPQLIARVSRKASKGDEDVKASLTSLKSIVAEEEEKRRLRHLGRYSKFCGTFTQVAVDGCKTLFKGNLSTASHDSLLKAHTIPRGPLKKIAWDQGRLPSSKDTLLEALHDFINQFLSGGYNVLMQSIHKDIEKECYAIQKSDIVVFFQVAQFVTAFQHHKFLISKPNNKNGKHEAFIDKDADSKPFEGEICGPIAATINESMFLLVLSKWQNSFDDLKETNDYKFLSVAGSLMKTMIRMLDLVLKLSPEDSKEPQTARILLYKLFYDQTEQGMTRFLMNLIRSFDTHKQPKSELADLVEMIHVVLRLMESLQARGTLRVSKKLRGRKKKTSMNGAKNDDNFGDHVDILSEADISNHEQSVDWSKPPNEKLINSKNDGKEDNILSFDQVHESEIPLPASGNLGGNPMHKSNEKFSIDKDDLAHRTGDTSSDEQPTTINEVDFKISTLVASFANNTVIQNLCWLLKFYKSNSASTNHYIICILRRICDDLNLSPMLYQLSLLTAFYDILVEQKSSTCDEFAGIVSFLKSLVRKMLKKMKSQPLLFVDILFWKTRKECHYINSESLLNELQNMKQEIKKWQSISSEDEGVGLAGVGRRSIADSLGEDEADFANPCAVTHNEHEVPFESESQNVLQQTEDSVEASKSMASNSNSAINGMENFDIDDTCNERHSLGHDSQRISKRRKRLVFNDDLKDRIQFLYEKYKDNRHCVRLIAEELDPSGEVSPVQVSNKLKQLGLWVTAKRKALHENVLFPQGTDQHSEGRAGENETALMADDLGKKSSLRRSFHNRKRICAFSKDQELMLKSLFEQFKDHESCNYMIAKALDADDTFTAAQVSRKLKQFGLCIPQRKNLSKKNRPLRDKNPDGLVTDERESDSDSETLLQLKKRFRNKENEKLFDEAPEQKTQRPSRTNYSDDESISTILKHCIKLETTLVQESAEREDAANAFDMTFAYGKLLAEIVARGQSSNGDPLRINENVEANLSNFDGKPETEVANFGSTAEGIGDELLDNGNLPSHQQMYELADELVDMEDDMTPNAPRNVALRRKLKMVIDEED